MDSKDHLHGLKERQRERESEQQQQQKRMQRTSNRGFLFGWYASTKRPGFRLSGLCACWARQGEGCAHEGEGDVFKSKISSSYR